MASRSSPSARRGRLKPLPSELRPLEAAAPPWRGLTKAPEILLDVEAIRAALDRAAAAADDRAEIRAAAVSILREALAEGRAAIAAEIAAAPHDAYRAVHDYAWLVDRIVTLTLEMATRWLHPLVGPTRSERICTLAVGGYGRAELAPFSDVDLLFVTPYKQTPWGESLIESVLYCLWDLRLKVGHAVRTVEDCLRLAKSDVTIRTSLLEHRYLWGDEALAQRLRARLWDFFDHTGPEFIELKLAERAERHARQGSSRYLLEPNVKEGKGGLRDLQTLFWLGKYLNHVECPEELVKTGVFTPQEFGVFAAAEAFLWTTRVHLHLLAGRAAEQLTFDTQVEIAATLGYRSTRGQRPVERFMQDYFTHAKHVGDLTRIFLAALEARHVKPRPSLGDKLRTVFAFGKDQARQGYRLKHGRLDTDRRGGVPQGSGQHPPAVRGGARGRDSDPPRRLAPRRGQPRPDRRPGAKRSGGEPDLPRPAARPQQPRRRAPADERGRRARRLHPRVRPHRRDDAVQHVPLLHGGRAHHPHDLEPLPDRARRARRRPADLHRHHRKGVDRRVLYVALLLHDIGKGSGRDHSAVGAETAARLCPRFGLDAEETELVVWLVQNHLLMSDVAQKRDLTEPRTVRDFAQAVKSPTRLKLLVVLTSCDIRGVGPGVWNNWKAMLLRGLYAETLAFLTGGSEAPSRPEREAAAKAALAAALEGWDAAEVEAECARHYPPYWLGFDTRTHVIFANLVRQLAEAEPAMSIELDLERDATQACFAMSDHPGIFARLAGALALAGANVVDARTYTSTDGIATAAFWLQDAEGKPYEKARLNRLRNAVTRTLGGEIVARDVLREKARVKKRERDFVVPTRISFDNTGSDLYTIIEVETRDRPGLLYDLARTLTANNVSISSAIIATYGEQAVDVFYVKDLFGLKLHAESKRRTLETRLKAAIAPVAGEHP